MQLQITLAAQLDLSYLLEFSTAWQQWFCLCPPAKTGGRQTQNAGVDASPTASWTGIRTGMHTGVSNAGQQIFIEPYSGF